MRGLTRVDLRVRRFNLHIAPRWKIRGLNRVGPRVPRPKSRRTSGLLSAGSGCDLTRVCFKSYRHSLTRFRFMSRVHCLTHVRFNLHRTSRLLLSSRGMRYLTRFRFMSRARGLTHFRFNLRAHSLTRIRFMSRIASGLFPLSVGTPMLFFFVRT